MAVGEPSSRPRIVTVLSQHARQLLAWAGQAVQCIAAQADDVAVALAQRILIEPPRADAVAGEV